MERAYRVDDSAGKVLLDGWRKADRRRNRLLFWAVALATVVGFCALSMVYGRIQAETLKNVRTDGMNVSAWVENGTEDTLAQAENLPCVKNTGLKKQAGKLYRDGLVYSDCVILDEYAYEHMLLPAVTDVHGDYPQETDEIMLSTRTLEYLGVREPKAGMKIVLEFYWDDLFCMSLTGAQEFTLSGYFRDWTNEQTQRSTAYLSAKRLSEAGLSWFPCRVLLETGLEHLGGAGAEQFLCRNMMLEDGQQAVALDAASYRAVRETAGGYRMAAACCLLAGLALFLSVYNIIYISMDRELRQYGLLETLGMTGREIRKLVQRQMARIWLIGSAAGGASAALVTALLYPVLLNHLYVPLEGVKVRSFYTPFLAAVCLGTGICLTVATACSFRRLRMLSPLQALRYESLDVPGGKSTGTERRTGRTGGRFPVWQLAWGNVTRSRGKFIMTVLSLALGCEMAMVSAVVTGGMDLMNRLEQNPDFQISVTREACVTLMEHSPDTWKWTYFDDAMAGNAADIAGVGKEAVSKIEGFIPIVDAEGQKSIRILSDQDDPLIIIQMVRNEDAWKLDQYVRKTGMAVDMETFLEKQGTLILHSHRMPEYSMEAAKRRMGEDIGVYDLVPVGTDMSAFTPVHLKNCGYLDVDAEDFPGMDLAWDGEQVVCLAVSEDTFRTLAEDLTRQIFQISFDVEKASEDQIKNSLKQWVRAENLRFQAGGYPEGLNLLAIQCNSDVVAGERNHVMSMRISMWTASGAFLLLGVMNYFHTRLADLTGRKRELAILESIGMTRKRLRRMLMLEGAVYCAAVLGVLLTAGSILLFLAGMYMEMKVDYFVFHYPLGILAGMGLLSALICTLIPCALYRGSIRTGAVERLIMSRW